MSEDDTDSESGIDVEEEDLSGGDESGDGAKGVDATEEGGVLGLLTELLVEVLRAILHESVGEELSRFFASYEKARSRLRTLGVLALTVLVLLLLAAIVWLLVGVVFLADRFPSTGDPLVFAVGVAVGYALAVVAGLVYR